jgi:hypothetical protein
VAVAIVLEESLGEKIGCVLGFQLPMESLGLLVYVRRASAFRFSMVAAQTGNPTG